MIRYTMNDIIKKFEERGDKSFTYLSKDQKETFIINELVTIINKNIELEERVRELESFRY